MIEDSGLISQKIATLPRMLVASPEFLAAHSDLKKPWDLMDIPRSRAL